MLALTRKLEQEIILDFGGATAVIRVIGLDFGKVMLGIDAPLSVRITRPEAKIKEQQDERGPRHGQ